MGEDLDTLYKCDRVEISGLPESSRIHILTLMNGIHPKKRFALPEGTLEKLATCDVDRARDAINSIDVGILPALGEYDIIPEYLIAAASRAYIKEEKIDMVTKIHHYLETLVNGVSGD